MIEKKIENFFVSGRLAVILLGILALTLGIIMSTIPWVDYFVAKVRTIILVRRRPRLIEKPFIKL